MTGVIYWSRADYQISCGLWLPTTLHQLHCSGKRHCKVQASESLYDQMHSQLHCIAVHCSTRPQHTIALYWVYNMLQWWSLLVQCYNTEESTLIGFDWEEEETFHPPARERQLLHCSVSLTPNFQIYLGSISSSLRTQNTKLLKNDET